MGGERSRRHQITMSRPFGAQLPSEADDNYTLVTTVLADNAPDSIPSGEIVLHRRSTRRRTLVRLQHSESYVGVKLSRREECIAVIFAADGLETHSSFTSYSVYASLKFI